MNQTKEHLKSSGHTQAELIIALRERGIITSPPELSQTLSGLFAHPKSKRVLAASEEIIQEWEQQKSGYQKNSSCTLPVP